MCANYLAYPVGNTAKISKEPEIYIFRILFGDFLAALFDKEHTCHS